MSATASTTTGAVVAIDAGQTGIKVSVEQPGAAPFERLFPGIRTHEPLLPQLAGVAQTVADDRDLMIGVLTAGVSGLTTLEADAATLRALLADRSTSPAPRVLLAHDSITSFLGALGDETGVVVAAGTGVVTLGVGRHRVARVDGWGYIMGDAGSGYWIGREALDAVMRAHDGRGEPTALTALVTERWPDLETAYIELQSASDRVSVVASLARGVAELAATDAVAADISRRAARELAASATTALRRVAEEGDTAPGVCAIGGVFLSPVLRARFDELIIEDLPAARLRPPRGAGIDGAAALARLSPQHALMSAVSVAG